MQQNFADRLSNAIIDRGTVLMVGLDPRPDRLPHSFALNLNSSTSEIASAYETFCKEIIDTVGSLVACVKPQAAFFEALGPAGAQSLWNVIRHAQEKKLLVIMDAKRGDIGSTAQAYASAYLGQSARGGWGCDALTVNPYLGDDSLTPFVDRCQETGAGIFVLVRTSNPGGAMLQELTANEQKVYQIVGQHVQSLAEQTAGTSGYGSVGAVVGATHPEQLAELRQQMPNTYFLVPGFGAQGGLASDVAAAVDSNGLGAVVNSSRGIIFAYENEQYSYDGTNWQACVEKAARAAIEALPKPCSPKNSDAR